MKKMLVILSILMVIVFIGYLKHTIECSSNSLLFAMIRGNEVIKLNPSTKESETIFSVKDPLYPQTVSVSPDDSLLAVIITKKGEISIEKKGYEIPPENSLVI